MTLVRKVPRSIGRCVHARQAERGRVSEHEHAVPFCPPARAAAPANGRKRQGWAWVGLMATHDAARWPCERQASTVGLPAQASAGSGTARPPPETDGGREVGPSPVPQPAFLACAAAGMGSSMDPARSHCTIHTWPACCCAAGPYRCVFAASRCIASASVCGGGAKRQPAVRACTMDWRRQQAHAHLPGTTPHLQQPGFDVPLHRRGMVVTDFALVGQRAAVESSNPAQSISCGAASGCPTSCRKRRTPLPRARHNNNN